jgi:hypothetical protein
MMSPPTLDPSDEATGLPPLDQPDPEDTIWAMVFTSGQADVFSPLDGSPQGCFVLSVRGVHDGGWAQMHLAVPHGAVTHMRDRFDEYLRMFPEVEN